MNESLNDIFDEIRKRLYIPLVFYFSRRAWYRVDKETWKDEKYNDYFDKVFIFKPDGSKVPLNNELSMHHIMIKKELLDKNTFILFEKEKSLGKSEFEFFLNKYITQLDFYCMVSTSMLKNIQKDIKDLTKETFLSFELQQKSFQSHWEFVQENFVGKSKGTTTPQKTNITEQDLKSLQELIIPSEVLPEKISPLKDIEQGIKPKKPKKKKKVLVTEEEATEFLLQTVFNIK